MKLDDTASVPAERSDEKELAKELYRLQAEICRTLADPVRLEILDMLKSGEHTVGELVEKTGLKQANVSQHLAVLRQTGLVSTRRQATAIYYSLAYPAIIQACDLTKQILMEQLAQGGRLAAIAKSTL
jgi:ArsR family transcriptional regulator, virulence genes transcriptional regulator